MVISDLNILCLKQKHRKKMKFSGIGIDSIRADKFKRIYGNQWSILSSFVGYWYNIYPVDKNNEYDYYRSFFDLNVRGAMESIALGDLSMNQFLNMIDSFIQMSPIHTIIILVRLDWNNNNTIVGTLKKDEFIAKLNDQELLFNTAYIIEE